MYLFDADVLLKSGGVRKFRDVVRWRATESGILDLEVFDPDTELTYHNGIASGFWRTITVTRIYEADTS